MDVAYRGPEAAFILLYSIITRGGSLRGERVVGNRDGPGGWRIFQNSRFTCMGVHFRSKMAPDPEMLPETSSGRLHGEF